MLLCYTKYLCFFFLGQFDINTQKRRSHTHIRTEPCLGGCKAEVDYAKKRKKNQLEHQAGLTVQDLSL